MKAKPYILLYIKRQLLLASLIQVAMLIAFSILALFDPSVRGRVLEVHGVCTLVLQLPILLGLICVFRFRRMIFDQEKALNVEFLKSNVYSFSKDPLKYLAYDWLIRAGSMAFHRDYIRGLTWGAGICNACRNRLLAKDPNDRQKISDVFAIC